MATGRTQGIFDIIRCKLHCLSNFKNGWFPFKFLFKFVKCLVDFINGTYFIEGKPDDPCLFGQGLENGLPDPPNGIGNKLKSTGFIKTLGGLYQAKVSFIDQIRKAQALVLVLFGNRDYKTKVGTNKFFKGYTISFFNSSCKFNFFFCRNEVNFANFVKIFIERGSLAVGNLLYNLQLSHGERD